MKFEDKVGQKIPSVNFKLRVGHDWKEKMSDTFFKGKKIALFALPGAFTPTCSSTHLPRYNELYDTFMKNGFDDVICLSVNDTFVMNYWQKEQKASKLTMLPDGNGEFSKKLGFLVDKSDLGFGKRSWRYSMIVQDCVIKKTFIEEDVPGDPFQISDADTMLKSEGIEIPESYAIYTRNGCSFCAEAKKLLDDAGIEYDEHVLNEDYSIKTLVAISADTTVPQIFQNGERVGGNASLKKLLNS
jgi:peroxiredoxin/glutaredoxin